ncbi:hypothetical protein BDP27DRAFT_1317779 [Rhodocollybia butyracea]|uniref:F-box domain-containing protein n=1 Tax=Rhodocollybia butyracea TaxID=206335 RepID=A0A9P5UD93_9AGAR|nr:hypothetical protein BDP27DRAFT_1317779 [Rhodocollybia butyracea]
MSTLLQDLYRSKTGADSKVIERKLNSLNFLSQSPNPQNNTSDDSDDELVNVVSVPGTPSRTRPSSPTRGAGAASRPLRGPLHLSSSPKTDPLKALPTEISQKIFSKLPIKDLAKCAIISKKWNRSQSINYVWFQHYRKENFRDESLPQGKWTKRESKQNWRITYLKYTNDRSPTNGSFASGYSSPSSNLGSGYGSGYQTPREFREDKWRSENEAVASPGKIEMRAMYKEMGGRKARGKTKLGSSGVRDKGGWAAGDDEW